MFSTFQGKKEQSCRKSNSCLMRTVGMFSLGKIRHEDEIEIDVVTVLGYLKGCQVGNGCFICCQGIGLDLQGPRTQQCTVLISFRKLLLCATLCSCRKNCLGCVFAELLGVERWQACMSEECWSQVTRVSAAVESGRFKDQDFLL